MKVISTLLFLCACFALNAQKPIREIDYDSVTVNRINLAKDNRVLIDQARKEPDLIVRSTLDTIEGDYITDAGIFRGYVVRKTHKVMYAAHAAHNGLGFDQVVAVLDDKKKPVKGVLGCRLFLYEVSERNVVVPLNLWQKYNKN